MKIFGIILLALILAGATAYIDGARLPYEHSVSVTGVVNAPPAKVFTMITNVAAGPDWRSGVKSVTLLRPEQGRDRWVEHLKYGQYMTFLAVRTDPPIRRDVELDDPNASYGGTWSYQLSPGPQPATTTLRITETGYIKPPLYRFVMAHVIGPTRNLNQYLTDLQAAAPRH